MQTLLNDMNLAVNSTSGQLDAKKTAIYTKKYRAILDKTQIEFKTAGHCQSECGGRDGSCFCLRNPFLEVITRLITNKNGKASKT